MEEVEEEPENKKKKVWFDRDRAINRAVKMASAKMEKLQAACVDRKDKLRVALAEISRMSAAERRHYAGEEEIAQVRLTTLEELNGSGEDLDAHIKSFKLTASTNGTSSKKAASVIDGSVGIGNAPPCSQYEYLLPLALVDASSHEFFDCTSQAEIVVKKKAVLAQQAPILDLLQSAKMALNDISKVKKGRESAAQPKASATKPPAKAGSASAAAVNLIFNELQGLCQQMQTLRCDEVKDKLDLSVPTAIAIAPEKHKELFEHKAVQQAMVDFAATFSGAGADMPRADAAVVEECAKIVAKFVKDIFPESLQLESEVAKDADTDALSQLLVLSSYGIVKGHMATATEKSHLPSVRISHKGTRTVAMTEYIKLVEFISKSAGGSEPDLTKHVESRTRCRHVLRNLRKEGLEACQADGGEVVTTTVGPTDMLYTPVGWIFTEQIGASVVCTGFRVPVIAKAQAATDFMKHVLKAYADRAAGDAAAIPLKGYVKAASPPADA